MICQRHHPKPLLCWFRAGLKVVAWLLVFYIMASGLTACKKQPISRSKFDPIKPQHDHFEKRHRRWN